MLEVCVVSSSVLYSERVPSGISSSVRERCLFRLLVLWRQLLTQKRTRKYSSLKEGINALRQLIGQGVTESLGEGINSRREIDLWLLHHPLLRRKANRE